ncbi:hypothetical protein pdam_00006577 [Pocillopora damicornis]|uniref:Saposin B-type domain-containing protein n=1 Tax=Pocillopora damicornis TaxID=46731 RepID=A0A3M6T8V3_POCDA|nr:hypothetical protein pdam_00006577 [Pocillopora damicornis]
MASKSCLVFILLICFVLNSFSKPAHEENGFTSWVMRLESDVRNRILSTGLCSVCKLLAFVAQIALLTNKIEADVVYEGRLLCKELKIEDSRVCTDVISEFRNEILTVADKAFLDPIELCGSLLGPSCAHARDLGEFWNLTVPGNKPPVKPVPPPKPGSPVSRVLHFSDVHLDHLYQEGSDPDCGEPLCCRKNDKPPAPGKPKAGKYGDYQCDIPAITFESMLQHISSTHQKEAINYASQLLEKYMPGVTIFPAVGNHEGAPVNSFPPPFITGDNSNQWLRDALANDWIQWLPNDTIPTIHKGIFYTVYMSKGFRIISINMNYCNNMNWWLLIDNYDPAHQLQWLIDTLQEAEDNGEKVHIIGHIPPGSGDCLTPWSWNYYRIINRYESTVTAQFFAHTHLDEFEIFYDEKTRKRPTKYYTKSARHDSCDDSCRKYTLCRMMSGRSHDDSACTLNTTLTQEEKHSFDQSLDFC